MLLRIGLTGGIGCGKSTVAEIFEVLGIPVFYADTETRKLMNEDPALRLSVIRHFGKEAYADGMLNRKHLASIVFNNREKLDLLNSLTHPVIMKKGDEWMNRQTSAYAIHEAALIFEANVSERLDYVIGVSAPQDIRIKRVMERDGISREEVLQRISRQMGEEEKMKRCDFILYNDEQQLLVPQVMTLHEKLSALSKQK